MKKIISFSAIIGILIFAISCSKDNDYQFEDQNMYAKSNDGIGQGLVKNEKALIVKEVTGTLAKKNGQGSPASFTADLLVTKFVSEGGNYGTGQLYAVGALTNISGSDLPANYKSLEGKVIKIPVEDYSTVDPEVGDVSIMQNHDDPTCPILNLVLGPLNLDLLGLTVFLDQVTLVIGAEPGQGQLLGNLLCSVVGLLDGGGLLSEITGFLNSIINLIGVIGNL
jgi:hypothetical protein